MPQVIPENGKAIPAKEDAPTEKQNIHPIARTVDSFVHSMLDHDFAAFYSLETIRQKRKEQISNIEQIVKKLNKKIQAETEILQIYDLRDMINITYEIKRLKNFKTTSVISNALFLGIFSAFDAFSGELLLSLYNLRPELFDDLNRSITFSEACRAKSKEEILLTIINDEIEQYRRKSYTEQFEYLEARFDLSLKKFTNWTKFVECGQRRNIITHCNGIVSDQYLTVCLSNGYSNDKLPKSGEKIKITPKYLNESCELLLEVGLKLGQTIWRKTIPTELELADEHLNLLLYDSLLSKHWSRSLMIGKFALDQHKISNDVYKKMFTVNYCIALKESGNLDLATKELNKIDWSSSSDDFKLAEAVLLDKSKEAAQFMLKIGKNGNRVNELAYHTWPLFMHFRETPEFLKTYKKIYKHSFSVKLQEEVASIHTESKLEESTKQA